MYAVLAALTGSLTPHRPVFLRLSVSFSLSLSLVSLSRMYIHAYIYNFFLSDLGWWVGCSFHQWCFQCSDNVLCQLASPFKFEKLGAD